MISAGIPWYSTIFGRDSIITSLQALPLQPRIAIDTLRYLARRQGRREDPYTEEQPGKILHELRRGEMARSGEIPHVPYYGSIDATPLWLILLHETWRWTGDDALVRELLPTPSARSSGSTGTATWTATDSWSTPAPRRRGWSNQGWKDSGDGVPFPDGRLPEPPIALVEVQGYVYDAKLRMAELYRHVGTAGAGGGRSGGRRPSCGTGSASAFWLEKLGTSPWRSTARSGRSRPRPPTPAICSGAGCRRRREARRLAARAFSSPTSSPAGASAR